MTAEKDLSRFNNTPVDYSLTPEQLQQNLVVGSLAADAYWGIEGKPGMIHRLPRFLINIPEGRVQVAGRREDEEDVMRTSGYDSDPIADFYGKELLLSGLRGETISPQLARMIGYSMAIERFLPDYMKKALELFRGNEGIEDSYTQWGNEEKQHGKVAELILLNTRRSSGEIGHMTLEGGRIARQERLLKGWDLPFPTGREIVAYAVFQELMTRDAYDVLSDRADQEGAPITASLLKLVAGDEAYHGGGYMKFLRLYHKHDPAGTVIDTLNVARQFQMPAMNLVYNELEAVQDAMDIGVYGSTYGQSTIERALKLLHFPEITDEVAADTANAYAEKQRRLANIFERRMQRRASGLLVPGEEAAISP